MWVRPVRQATAWTPSADEVAATVLVHRNELNEQQRPGSMVFVPQKHSLGKGQGEGVRWQAKLLRSMEDKQKGGTTAVESLLFYTGAFIEEHGLDPAGHIPEAMKQPGVLFITNHVDAATSGANMVSSMRGKPIKRVPDGSLIEVRTQGVIDPATLEDNTVDDGHEHFHFGGYVAFKLKEWKGSSKPVAVESFTPCTPANIDRTDAILPNALWADKVASAELVMAPACPWGADVVPCWPLRHVLIMEGGDYDGESIRGFYDPVSGFGEGCAYQLSAGGREGHAIPLVDAGAEIIAQPLRDRRGLTDDAVARRFLAQPREHRAWLRHQHELTIDAASAPIRITKSAVTRPISICAPGGAPFQLNKTASDDTFVVETAITDASHGLAALHPPSLGERMRGVRKWLAPARKRTLKLAQKSIRRNTFAKVARMRDDTRVSILKLEISDYGQERAAALDVWGILDVSNMDDAELSYHFEDGVDSIEDTVGFSGGMHPKEIGFFVFQHHAKNEITYSPVHDVLSFTVAIRWYDMGGDWRAGAPEQPEDPSLQYSLVHNKWVTEAELNSETLGDRKRKYGVFLDTLYK